MFNTLLKQKIIIDFNIKYDNHMFTSEAPYHDILEDMRLDSNYIDKILSYKAPIIFTFCYQFYDLLNDLEKNTFFKLLNNNQITSLKNKKYIPNMNYGSHENKIIFDSY